jgi:hypothetical protein
VVKTQLEVAKSFPLKVKTKKEVSHEVEKLKLQLHPVEAHSKEVQ